MKITFSLFFLAAAAFLTACTGTSRLAAGEKLYAGAKTKITKPDKNWETKILKNDLKNAVVLPRTNKKILWLRPKLAIFYTFQNRRKGSFGNFVATRFGEPPGVSRGFP